MQNISKIAKKAGITDFYTLGEDIAKINSVKEGKQGKLILVTAMTSNKTGIGKTTISIGLADALNKLNKKTIVALREPSMGPVFGVKGGATGGGKSRVEPSDKINLHFTGDFYAIAQANNLLASAIDNHIYFGNALNIDTNNIFFKRCLDLNERSLREIKYNIRDKEITTGFNITAASEIMAIMCLATSLDDLKERLGNILVALTEGGEPVIAKDLHVEDAMTILLTEALKPNLVQTLEGTPAIIHLGPFANIAHGCNSVLATKMALNLGEYCVTEAGFGSDLGGEKFLDIKTRLLDKTPDAVVLVIVTKVIKEHGNGDLIKGFANVKKHIFNLTKEYNLPLVVAINKHDDDTQEDINALINLIEKQGVKAIVSNGFSEGGDGCIELAKQVINLTKSKTEFKYCYNLEDDIKTKIEKIAKKIYGAKNIVYSDRAENQLKLANKLGCQNYFVNVAKTQFSFSNDKELLGAPEDFVFNVTDLEIRNGAKMIVPIAGSMLLMPGLAKTSNYENMHIDNNGNATGII